MPQYELELGEQVKNLICECCNQPVKRVWGFVSKDDWAHAVYYALLAEHDGKRWVGLTISIGKWWEDGEAAIAERQWCHMRAWSDEENFVLGVQEPDISNFYPWKSGGKPMTRDEVLSSPIKDDFFAVADHVNVQDPAINSFLLGEEVNIRGRVCVHDDGQEMPKQ